MSRIVADAYADTDLAVASGRQLEASALFRVARRLQAAQEGWGHPGHEARFDEALRTNQRLWTFFQAELGADDNPLPTALKVSLLQLIQFIDRRTFDALASPAPDKLTVLININRNVAAGLAAGAGPRAA